MAWKPPGAGALRHSVQFLRRPLADRAGETGDGDGAGNYDGAPIVLIDQRACQLLPMRGGEEVIAGRAQGVDLWTLVVRRCAETDMITAGDIVQDRRDTRGLFNIKGHPLDLEGRGRWLVMTLERGKAVG